MIGTQFYKNNLNYEEYGKAAIWCNTNHAKIEDKGDYYEVVEIPKITLDDLKIKAFYKLWKNYKTFQETYVDAEDLILAVICASYGSEKGKSIQMWVMNLWSKYYEIKNLIMKATTIDELNKIDFIVSFDKPQYTIEELNIEVNEYLNSTTNIPNKTII